MRLLPHRSAPLVAQTRRGMTLVEILVVLAILSILMAIIGTQVWGNYQKGLVSVSEAAMRQVEQQLTIYSAQHRGKFPSTSDGLTSVYGTGEDLPLDGWGNEFQYYSPGSHGDHKYEIISLGADGQEGGDGNDADINSWDLGKDATAEKN